jgi:virulence factor Mce-like protein
MKQVSERLLHRADRQTVIGAVMIFSVLVFIGLAFTGKLASLLTSQGEDTVRAQFADAQQLKVGDPVRIAGVQVGNVDDIELMPRGAGAVVTMRLGRDAGPVYADARAALRTKTVLGGAFAVTLDRGNPATGHLGDKAIPIARTSGQVEVEDLLGVMRGGARRGMQRLPREMGRALQSPRILSGLLGTLDSVAPDVEGGAAAFRGQIPGYDLRELVSAGARTMAAFDRPAGDVRMLVSGSARTLRTTAARAAELRAAIATLPAALRETDGTLTRLRGTLDVADPVLERFGAAAPGVAPALRRLRPVVQRADLLLRTARPLLRELRPTTSSLAETSRNTLSLLRAVLPSLDRFDRVLLPMLAEKDPVTEKPTSVMIGGWAAGVGSGATGSMDANGHFIRFPATGGSAPAYLPCQTYANNPDKEKQVECQSLQEALRTVLSTNPAGPAPGSGGGDPQGNESNGDAEDDP